MSNEQLHPDQVARETFASLPLHGIAAAHKCNAQPPKPVCRSNMLQTETFALEGALRKRSRVHTMETRSMVSHSVNVPCAFTSRQAPSQVMGQRLQASPFRSMAEQIAVFEGRLPGRSRWALGGTAASTAASAPGHPGPGTTAALTVPVSPKFETKKRVRAPRFKPRDVVEAEEMASMPKFKARPVK